MKPTRPDPNADGLEPYRIHAAREIVSFLQEIRRQRQLIRMSFSEGRESALTSILDIDVDGNIMYVDAVPDPAQNRRIALTRQVTFETTLDRIRIQFAAYDVQRCDHAGFPALRFAIPASLIRVQRRQFYRVAVPDDNPLRCIFMPPGTDLRPLTAPMPLDALNISIGGIAVVDAGYLLDGRPGAVYPTCQISFPGYPVTVALEVKYAHIITLNSGQTARQIGCRFVDAPNQIIALVQRYILKLERDQNAKSMRVR